MMASQMPTGHAQHARTADREKILAIRWMRQNANGQTQNTELGPRAKGEVEPGTPDSQPLAAQQHVWNQAWTHQKNQQRPNPRG